MNADFNTTCQPTIGKMRTVFLKRRRKTDFPTEFASHSKSPRLKGKFRSLVPRHVEEEEASWRSPVDL